MNATKDLSEIKDLTLHETSTSSPVDQQEIPVLPLEVLRQSINQLGNVVDLANVALVCREWRELIYSCDACWEKAFFRDYNQYNAEDYASLPTWRQKYIAHTMDLTCLKLRSVRHSVGVFADNVDLFERRKEELENLAGRENPPSDPETGTIKRLRMMIEAIKNQKKLLDETMIELESLRAKKASLEAATNYRPKCH